ncbi:MAG: T9SS type A sorting domain-containing protein [Ignavibacteria bacterium]|nr:T9SS type A sorting domain-containing protein [Ignavibacteria bacterium]
MQKRTQKNSAARSLFAVRNNTITFLTGETGISALSVYESEVDISHNSITNQYGADVGIYSESLEEVPSVAIEQNFIRNVANGIFVDIIYASEDVGSGTVNINSNNIESGNNGLYFPDVNCRHASMSMNTVRAITEKTREQHSPTQQNTFTGEIGIFTEAWGVLEADSNSIEGFASAFELYCELLTSISGNTITETENAIYLDYDIYSDSLIIDNNIISHCLGDANILLGSFYNDEIFNSRVSISGNTIDNTNADAIENAIYIESVLSHLLEVNNNTIVHTPGVGIYLGEFEGYSEFKKNTSSKNGKEKEVRSQDKFRGKRLSGLQRKNQFDRQTHKDKRIRNRRDESSKKQPLKHLNFPTAMISLNNNSISLAQDGYEPSGVFCGGFSYASVDIRGNSIISETQEAWGMYVDNIYETYIIRIEQNSIKNVSDGLSVYSIEYSYDYEEPTILSLIGNSAENYAGNGLYIGDVDNASEITISENDLKGVSTNTILDDGITVYGDCKKIICNDNIVSNFSVGMEFDTDCLYGVFSRNQISKNVLGMSLSVNDFYVEPLISSHYFFEKNTFTFNETALEFWGEIFIPLLFRENNIRSNISNGLVIYGSSVFIQSNHLYNNGGLDLENNSSASLNAEYNWWGPTTTAEMNSNPYPSNISAIYDSFDNNSIGFVNYKNWLQDSVKILRGIILGKAFEDYEGNGLYDDEDFIENRKIILSGAANETTYTDEFGSYSFTNLLPGTYYIYQILPNDWVQTFPDSQYTIIIDSNEVELGKFFGSFKFASASGYVFNDKNGNGIKDNNEAFLENWKVKLTGVRNDSALTNSTGEYQFHQLTPGDYEIQLVLKQGWRYTHPSSGNWYRLISSGDSIPSFHFGVYQPGKISGFVFNDADSNGVRDSNEVGLSGWKVFLSGAKSDSIMSNSFGYYEFDRLFSGTYTVREQRKPQWIQTSPPMAVYQIILDDGLVHENINFGNYLPLLGIYDKNSPLQFSLSQNYPNPFNPVTHFQFSLAKEEFVSLKIYNLIGEDIATLLSKELPAGTYSVEWNAEKFSNGMYFYRLQAGKFVDAKKLLLQK